MLTYDLWLEGWLHFPSLDLLPTDQFEKYVALDALFSLRVLAISWKKLLSHVTQGTLKLMHVFNKIEN